MALLAQDPGFWGAPVFKTEIRQGREGVHLGRYSLCSRLEATFCKANLSGCWSLVPGWPSEFLKCSPPIDEAIVIDSTAGKAFALHTANAGSNPSNPLGPPSEHCQEGLQSSEPGVIPKHCQL